MTDKTTTPAEPLLIESDSGFIKLDGRGLTTNATSNSEMFARILTMYARPGMTIIDPTEGNGVFWNDIDPDTYDLHRSDPLRGGPDARSLPWCGESAHIVVLDPPYRYNEIKSTSDGLRMAENDIYNLASLNNGDGPKGHDAVMALYRDAMHEATRVLMLGGYLIVKCQDTITDGAQQWVHVDLMAHATEIGCPVIDLAVVTPSQVPPTRWPVQRSLRKAHSYFLVCRKGGRWPFGYRSVTAR